MRGRRPWTVPELAALAATIGTKWPGKGAMSALAQRLERPLREVSRKKRQVRHVLVKLSERGARRCGGSP